MTPKERYELVVKGGAEIVTEPEMRQLLAEKERPIIYCGYEVSGPFHVGHLTTVWKFHDCLRAGFLVKILLPDIHTRMNRKGQEAWIREMVEHYRHCFAALGLGPERAEIIVGSDFQLGPEYFLGVLNLSLLISLDRARRSMDRVGRNMENPFVSQLLYAIMQAEDIHALKVDVAYGGEEQRKIHMLARDIFPKVGRRPPICLHTPLVVALDGGEKMSSSRPGSYIAIYDEETTIRAKVRNAFCPPRTPEPNPVLDLCRFHLMRDGQGLEIAGVEYSSFEALCDAYAQGRVDPARLKEQVADGVVEMLAGARAYFRGREKLLKPLVAAGYQP